MSTSLEKAKMPLYFRQDFAHYGKIAVGSRETIRLMAEIDQMIEAHGGFPLVGSQEE